jgi:hypothetical protein
LESWEEWAKRVGFKTGTIRVEEAKKKMEETVRQLNDEFDAEASLPWL